MGMLENLKKAVGDTLINDIQMIEVDNLVASEDNFFEVTDIETFSQTILGQGGVKENLIVKPLDNGKYEIISGHRRTAAVRYLLENEESISRFLPCLIQEYQDEDDKLIDLILMNVSARVITDNEMYTSYEKLTELIQRKKEKGEKFGNIQIYLSTLLKVSPAQIAKIQNIDHNAEEIVKEAIKNGDLTISTANEIVKLDKDKQKEIIQNNNPKELKLKEIKQLNDKKVTTNDNFSEEENEKEEIPDLSFANLEDGLEDIEAYSEDEVVFNEYGNAVTSEEIIAHKISNNTEISIDKSVYHNVFDEFLPTFLELRHTFNMMLRTDGFNATTPDEKRLIDTFKLFMNKIEEEELNSIKINC